MTYERIEYVTQCKQLWLPVHQRNHVDAKYRLQLGLLVQLIEHHVTGLATTQFDNHAHAVFI